MVIQENVPLAALTTLKVGGPARYFVQAHTIAEVSEAVSLARSRNLALFVLGGGSNLVISDAGWPGLVLKISIPDIEERSRDDKSLFEVGAGEDWDKFVAYAVSRNCAGIECMSGIPGSVGGTPVQNVGAYGQEVAETIAEVRAFDTKSRSLTTLSNADCRFSYRTSIFNSVEPGRYVVLRVSYALTPNAPPHIEYADLKKFFATRNAPTLAEMRAAIREIRHRKAMLIVEGDPDCRSAGSFFKNPIVDAATDARVQQLAAERGLTPPRFATPEGTKLSAAWLVEQSGFHKGYSRGAVGISSKPTLAIVNRGGAKATDIVALKDEIQQRVLGTWGIDLHPEPVLLGFEDLA